MTTPDHVHDSNARPPIDADSIDAGWFTRNTIRIAKFDSVFVLSYSKRVMERKTPLPWIAHPTSLDSRGYHATFDEFDGQTAAALYGTFLNLVKLSTLSPPYGSLAHSDGEPFRLPYIANRTRIPAELIIRAVTWFRNIGWLEADRTVSSCRHDAVMTPTRQRHDYDTVRDDNGTERDETQTADTPPGLLNLIARWNTLAESGHVPHKANSEPPAKAVLKAWGKAERVPELQTALSNVEAIEAAIRGSPFVHAAGWFRLEKLIHGTNREGTFILTKLLEGGFADHADRPRATHSQQKGTNDVNRNGLSAAERTERANADALAGFLGSDDETGLRESDDRAVLPQTNGRLHSGSTGGMVRHAGRLPPPDDQSGRD